jgi:tetratricopeptide (TPR) repeat protein
MSLLSRLGTDEIFRSNVRFSSCMRIVLGTRWRSFPLEKPRLQESSCIQRIGKTALKFALSLVLFLASMVLAAPGLRAQASDSGNGSGAGQNQPAAGPQTPAPQQQPSQSKPQTNPPTSVNPFPDNTDSVPVMPTRESPDLPPSASDKSPSGLIPMPVDDADPMRSPEDVAAAAESSDSSSSSSLSGLRDLPSPDGDTAQHGKHNGKGEQVVPEHHETAAEDESVGSYYLGNKDWKGALSRFQSALVLDPDNPDVYWGLAECERHTGDFADARANYLKVREYDPGSRHAKEAGKALEDPEIANAKTVASGQTAPQPQH